MKYLHLFRWKNLLMIALVQILIKYALFEPFLNTTNLSITLNWFGFSLLVLATVSLAAAGNVINDVFDVETDMVNKPEKVLVGKTISEKTAYNLFIVLNVIGVGIGFYLSNLIGRSGFSALFIIVSALLYIYASYLKQMVLVGNLVISLLVAFSIVIVGLYELLPAITPENQLTQTTFFEILLDYAKFAFLINFIREIAKDLEDIDGDHKAGMNTLPIAIGRERASKVLFALLFIPVLGVAYYVLENLYKHQLAIGYFLVLVIGPLIYLCIKAFSAKTKKDFHHISQILKLVMLFGMLSLLLYKYILINN